jgi:hypothetical protein
MAKISIPERYQKGVAKIRTLDMAAVSAIRDTLDHRVARIPDTQEEPTNPSAVARTALEAASPRIEPDELKQMADALVSLYAAASRRDIPLDDFIDGVAEALITLPSSELRLPPEQKDEFKEKLNTLLNADVFALVTKVDELRAENERVFCHARIVTDLRPVFGKELEHGPIAMLVEHNLKIAFHEAGRKGDHQVFFSLDAKDLQELRRIIDRAEIKARTLRGAVSNVRIIGVRE